MPRRRRGLLDHTCYHITHRCHERDFLLKFGVDRDRYIDFLFRTKNRFRIEILNYIVTSNHVHLLVWSRNSDNISRAIQYLDGRFAQLYNRRKGREGAFWRDRYSITAIESGVHLSRCLFYTQHHRPAPQALADGVRFSKKLADFMAESTRNAQKIYRLRYNVGAK